MPSVVRLHVICGLMTHRWFLAGGLRTMRVDSKPVVCGVSFTLKLDHEEFKKNGLPEVVHCPECGGLIDESCDYSVEILSRWSSSPNLQEPPAPEKKDA